MLTDIKAYILSSDLCRQNIKDFQESDQFTPEEQTRIKNAYNKGW